MDNINDTQGVAMNTKTKVSETEISRRLWRIYEMALAAAERVDRAEREAFETYMRWLDSQPCEMFQLERNQ
jgi:hypothetical protein